MDALPSLKNPLNEQRRKELKDDAQEFLNQFGIQFLKSYAWAFFNKIKAAREITAVDLRKLRYRDFNEVQRKDLFTGSCYICVGDGPGTFGKWKEIFLEERQDYNFNVYKSEKAYVTKRPPSGQIKLPGYRLVSDVTAHYRNVLNNDFEGLGLTEAEKLELLNFSRYSFALVHPQRTDMIFQFHHTPKNSCCCLRGAEEFDPEAGSEFADEKKAFVEAMGRCLHNATATNDSLLGDAFSDAVSKLKASLVNLRKWSDEGTEVEVLSEMAVAQCLPGLRDDILRDLEGPASVRIRLWVKTQGVICTILSELIEPVWAEMNEGVEKMDAKVRPVVDKGIGPILTVINRVKEAIEVSVRDQIASVVSEIVNPHLKSIFDILDEPLAKGFREVLAIFDGTIQESALPDDVTKRNESLDEIPRTQDVVVRINKISQEVIAPLTGMKKTNPHIFEGVDPDAIQAQSEKALLRTLDGAVYTLQERMSEEEGRVEEHKTTVLEHFRHDALVARAAFSKKVMRGILIPAFNKACKSHTGPVISGADAHIPEELREFISTQGVWDEMMDTIVGGAIDKTVEGSYEMTA